MDSQVLIKYFWIVLAIVVFLIFYYKIDSFREQDNLIKDFEIDFFVRDMALLIDRMTTVPGSVTVEYPAREGYNGKISGKDFILKYQGYEVKYGVIGDVSKISIKNEKNKIIFTKNE